jgi:uncharacterized protein YkwD
LYVLILLILSLSLSRTANAQGGYDPSVQTSTLLYDEARTVYLGNLARQDNGVPPLRWNRQLTYAARWFSWDSTVNQPSGFCGHQDSLGNWPNYRALFWGYLGSSGAENSFCGYVSPEYAIQGWMDSPGHRANLLDPNSREIGMGYYRRDSDGRGYLTQDFGNDAVYAPMIIEHEALSTTSQNVNLYIYDRSTSGGFAGFSAATQMMVSNTPYFNDAIWEPYNANKAWILADNAGWQDVYVKTRDQFNRTMTTSDSIYFGVEASIPLDEIGTGMQMSTTQSDITLYDLNSGTFSDVQFSLGWLADDTFATFNKWWGNGESVNDISAWGGTAYRLYPGDGESFAWVYDTSFIQNTPMVAYFRLKVNDNTSGSEVARISIKGGPTEYGPISLKGTDFIASNQYQEFALNFTFNSTPEDPFLIFQFWRSGTADVYVDAVSIFTVPQPISSPLTWSVPGENYRGQGVWVRYTDGSQFSDIVDGITVEPETVHVQSIMRVGSSPTFAPSVDFALTFSEPVTGVDTDDFILTTTGVSGASVTDVNGADDIYTVTVATGTGSGTIRLDVLDDDSIEDGTGKPLGGTGEHNGDYINGEIYTLEKGNDAFQFATNITELAYMDGINTVYATSNPNDPILSELCGIPGNGQATVWYTYTPNSDSAISVDTAEADYDTFIAIWEGDSLENLNFVACNDDAGSTKQSAVAIRVTGGHTYYIEIGQP